MGHYDVHGQLYIVDRVKDLIKCMDQQVAPAELEELLMRHELVRQAAVAGVPHRQYGEAPRAFVVLAEEAQGLSPQDVAQQLSELIAGKIKCVGAVWLGMPKKAMIQGCA